LKLRGFALLMALPSVVLSQDSVSFQFSGTAINTTSADNPVAAPIQITIRNGACTLVVSPPLTGSGGCNIKTYDEKTGKIEIVSLGPPTIVWSGSLKGNLFSGAYKIDIGAQTGYFYLALLNTPPAPTLTPKITPPSPPRAVSRSSCSPAIESSISGEIEGWSGETIFKLDNGQTWQQSEYDYTYFYEYHPDVTIYETRAGCRMKVEDESDTVLVKRIK
jgi:hypothetical protein